jgi:thiamine kinase-like enzyme
LESILALLNLDSVTISGTSHFAMAVVIPGVPHFDESFPSDKAERVPFLYRILGLTIPISDCVLKDLPGGWTNTVYLFETPERRYTVREYGAATGLIMDREAELSHIKTLGMLEIYATFLNGTVLTYQEGIPTTVITLQEQKVSDAVATLLAKVHKATLGKPGPTTSEAWGRIDKFLKGIPETLKDCDKQALAAKIQAKRAHVEEKFKGRPICLCHNDLTPGNLLWDEKSQSLGLIDYEYSFYNWPEYDIANHFFERVGLDFDISLFPQPDQQKQFIRTYLTELNGKSPTDELVEEWRDRVNELVQLSGVLWGTWGWFELGHATEETWPYGLYAKYRLILSELQLPLPEGHELRSHKLLPTC